MKNKKRIYLISPEKITDVDGFLYVLEGLLEHFHHYIFAFQLRVKPYNSSLFDIGARIYKLCTKYNTLFIINDYLDLAVKLGTQNHCDGLHLGQSDFSDLTKCKNLLPSNMMLGISCHNNINIASEAVKLGANYVSFGAFFPSKTKPDALGKPTIKMLHEWLKLSNVATVAIGGIAANNCKPFTELPEIIIAISHYVWFHINGPVDALKKITQEVDT